MIKHSTLALVILAAASSIGLAALAETAPAPKPTASAPPAPAHYGDWLLRCLDLPSALPCDIIQSLEQKDSKARVLAVSIAYSLKENKHLIQISLPLGIDLRRGVDIAIGDVTAKHVSLSRCELSGCIIEAVLANDMLGAMQKNDKGKVLLSADGQPATTIEFSLKGFNDAEAALKQEALARESKAQRPAERN